MQFLFPNPSKNGGPPLSEELNRLCRVVYRKTKDGRFRFESLWNPESEPENSDECVVVPVGSVIGKPKAYTMTDTFANIIKSTDDPNPTDKPWIRVMEGYPIDCSSCATDGRFYDPSDPAGQAYFEEIVCKNGENDLVGGHVTFGTVNQRTEDIVGATVYLLPICRAHNIKRKYGKSGEPGSGYYMRPKRPGNLLTLHSYFQLSADGTLQIL